jgi:hypothetical protein
MSDLDPDLEAWKSSAKVVWANNSPPIHEDVVAAIALDLACTIVDKLAKPDTDSAIKVSVVAGIIYWRNGVTGDFYALSAEVQEFFDRLRPSRK